MSQVVTQIINRPTVSVRRPKQLTYRRNGGGRFLLVPTLVLGCRALAPWGGGFGSKGATAAGCLAGPGACPAKRVDRRVAMTRVVCSPTSGDQAARVVTTDGWPWVCVEGLRVAVTPVVCSPTSGDQASMRRTVDTLAGPEVKGNMVSRTVGCVCVRAPYLKCKNGAARGLFRGSTLWGGIWKGNSLLRQVILFWLLFNFRAVDALEHRAWLGHIQ